ncbi:type II toxin-antitoxin system HicA family toxin [Methanothrix sp.]|uniref:type II toxin-antitoxin system HicA family toxin n=1 Tax=Methanothrix sp. TaxID=90426 RepID=UPI0032AE8650
MSRLAPVSRVEMIRRLKKLGFEGPFPGKRHQHLIRGTTLVIIPNLHHGQDISADLIVEILRKAKISRDEWLSVA